MYKNLARAVLVRVIECGLGRVLRPIRRRRR